VHSEFEMGKSKDVYLHNDTINHIVGYNHPINCFNVGNTDTLRDHVKDELQLNLNIKDIVEVFRSKFYNPNNCCIVLNSFLPKEKMIEVIIKYFSVLKNLDFNNVLQSTLKARDSE